MLKAFLHRPACTWFTVAEYLQTSLEPRMNKTFQMKGVRLLENHRFKVSRYLIFYVRKYLVICVLQRSQMFLPQYPQNPLRHFRGTTLFSTFAGISFSN